MSSETLTLKPVEDAYVSQRFPAINYDNAPAWPVSVDAQNRERYPLLRFDTSGIHPDSQVVSAELELWLEQGDGEALVDIIVQRITLGWDETTVTWNNRPPMQGTWGRHTTDTDPGWRDWDLRVLTQNWVRESMPNHGIVLRGPAGVEFERLFESTGAREPRLVVVFDPPTPTTTPTASATATMTPTLTATSSPTPTATGTPTSSPTVTEIPTATSSPTPTATTSPIPSETPSPTLDPTSSATAIRTPSATAGVSPSSTSGPGDTPTPTMTPPIGASQTPLPSPTEPSATTAPTAGTGTAATPGVPADTPTPPAPVVPDLYLPSLGNGVGP